MNREKPRVGHIDFLNCLPLTYGLSKGLGEGMEVYADVPAKLNEAIVDQRLDISPVSSIVYARNHEKLLVLPDISITADGMVQSIILVSRKPIEKLAEEKIILTAKSATSHCLLKVVMQKSYGVNPQYDVRPIDLTHLLPQDAAAALLIGDDALYVHHHHEAGLYYYDIGNEWKKLTGERMVYAVWVVNKVFAKENPRQVQMVYERIREGFRSGYAQKVAAIASLNGKKPFSAAQLEEYLEVIKWDFTEKHQEALAKFYAMSYALGLIACNPKIEMAEVIRCV